VYELLGTQACKKKFRVISVPNKTQNADGTSPSHWRVPCSFFDMQHLVFKHNHLSFIRMEWLLLKAHLLYYTRSEEAIQDILHHIKKHRLGIQTLLRFLRDYFGG
jgi:hypothetical protein